MHETSALNASKLEMENEMIGLHQSINALIPDSQKKVIQFLGTREKEGTSSIVREFAIVSVMKLGKTTLLLDASGQSPVNMVSVYSLEEAMQDHEPIDKALYQVAKSSLFFCQFFKPSSSPSRFLDASGIENPAGIDELLGKLTLRFDLVLIDSPPGTTFSTSLAVSEKVNGVILVVEAEKTRWPVVDHLRDTISKKGGRILGVVLNKRRYHIPNFIYRLL